MQIRIVQTFQRLQHIEYWVECERREVVGQIAYTYVLLYVSCIYVSRHQIQLRRRERKKNSERKQISPDNRCKSRMAQALSAFYVEYNYKSIKKYIQILAGSVANAARYRPSAKCFFDKAKLKWLNTDHLGSDRL